jgi:hypothetical protein
VRRVLGQRAVDSKALRRDADASRAAGALEIGAPAVDVRGRAARGLDAMMATN